MSSRVTNLSDDDIKRAIIASKELSNLIHRIALRDSIDSHTVRARMPIFIDGLLNALGEASNSDCLFCSIGSSGRAEVTVHTAYSDSMRDTVGAKVRARIQNTICKSYHRRHGKSLTQSTFPGLDDVYEQAPAELFPSSVLMDYGGCFQRIPMLEKLCVLLQAHEYYRPPTRREGYMDTASTISPHLPTHWEATLDINAYFNEKLPDACWDREADNHLHWSTTNFHAWLNSRPFIEPTSQCMLGGYIGTRWPVFAIARILMQTIDHPKANMDSSSDFEWAQTSEVVSTLCSCARLLYRQVAESLRILIPIRVARQELALGHFKYRELLPSLAGQRTSRIRTPTPPPSGQSVVESILHEEADEQSSQGSPHHMTGLRRTSSEPSLSGQSRIPSPIPMFQPPPLYSNPPLETPGEYQQAVDEALASLPPLQKEPSAITSNEPTMLVDERHPVDKGKGRENAMPRTTSTEASSPPVIDVDQSIVKSDGGSGSSDGEGESESVEEAADRQTDNQSGSGSSDGNGSEEEEVAPMEVSSPPKTMRKRKPSTTAPSPDNQRVKKPASAQPPAPPLKAPVDEGPQRFPAPKSLPRDTNSVMQDVPTAPRAEPINVDSSFVAAESTEQFFSLIDKQANPFELPVAVPDRAESSTRGTRTKPRGKGGDKKAKGGK